MRNLRINLTFFFIILFSAVLLSRLFFIQVLQADFYKALAQGLGASLRNYEIQTERGEIFLKNKESLAINKNWSLVFASPPKITEMEETAEILAAVLNLDKNFISEKLQKDTLYSPIKKKLTEEEVTALENLNLAGIYLDSEQGRYYPQESLASQVIGFLGATGKGQYGLEEYYDETLVNSGKGSDLVLTLDYNIQFTAEKLLNEAKENLDIESGQIIVMEPNSGKILALANFPNFNPNQYTEYATAGFLEIFQNGATQKLFEPGSIFKPITFAIALEEEKITPQTTYIDEGVVKIGGWSIYNYDLKVWGEKTMTEVLEKSINTGAVFVERKLPHKVFLDYLTRFGIFEPTGIDLPEVYSENKEFKKGYEINFATASFGQGIEMTPIQIVRAISCIANGGKLVKPYLIERNDEVIETQPRVISQKTASQLTAMLVSSVENGYANRAKISGYYIAGKTGTSQIPFSNLGINKSGYSDKTWQSFIGFAPAFDPKFLILVKLDNPKAQVAGVSTTLVAHDLMKYIIDYYQIPPDYESD